jgi:predicted CXXCH cytochrome family protein
MAFRLRTVETTATGREIVRDRVLPGPTLTIGRAAENDIHLPDLAVEPQHATITERDSGRIEIESVGSLGFTVDLVDQKVALVDTRGGAELGFGTYRIMAGREGDEILLTVRQTGTAATRSGDLEGKRGFSLGGVLPGKRGVSWAVAIVILLAFLAVPVISHLTRNVAAEQSVIGDQSWNPGDLSLAHHGLTDKCESCHVKAFESVRDETCMSCHKDLHDHADPKRLAAARGNQPLGTQLLWSVAHTFGKEGPGACQDCHVEHQGAKTELAATSQQFCADCHGQLKTNLTDTKLGDAGDFGTLHPQFNPGIVVDPATRKIQTVSLDKNPREDNGLFFPHKLHLDPKGGAARMAGNIGAERGYGSKGMQCQDCHRKTEDGIRFKPIDMERDCEGCHSLAYDQVGGTFRRLKHGDVDQVIADLTAADITRPLPNPRRRPGEYADSGTYRFNFSQPVWQGLQVQTALSRDGICGECHRPTFAGGKPGVLPVTLQSRYMKHGWFDHAAHKQQTCTSCHAAKTSTTATDLLLPGIKDCRTCHLGEDAHNAKVPSSCAMCHGYHATAQGAQKERRRSSS